ncbi:MAG: glycosyltransferase family 2 protein [Pseudooceanicola sp.]
MPNTIPADSPACLGVVIVTYNSADVVLACLETLLASSDVALRIAIVDNASQDGTPDVIRDWAEGAVSTPLTDLPFPASAVQKPVTLHSDFAGDLDPQSHAVTLVQTGANLGFAGGVNRGLAVLAGLAQLDRFWVLNPDSVVPPQTAAAIAGYTPPGGVFSLMGGRVLYLDNPAMIQIDGGTIARRTGITGNMGLYAFHADTPPSDPAAMDFITGASMVASRAFYEAVGPMREDYFLYYEEVDWALRRGDLPLAYCAEALVYHHGGSAIGSATHNRPASPFALYFKHRARMLFLRRFFPASVITAHVWSLAKAAQFASKGFRSEARALLAGAFGRLPPETVRKQLSATTLSQIFGKAFPAADTTEHTDKSP